jgi:hypothetical protein
MKYLKVSLRILVCLGVLAFSTKLYADEFNRNREDIRARESSAPVRAEAAQEAQRAYESRIAAYGKVLSPQGKEALENFLENKASSGEKAEFISGRSAASLMAPASAAPSVAKNVATNTPEPVANPGPAVNTNPGGFVGIRGDGLTATADSFRDLSKEPAVDTGVSSLPVQPSPSDDIILEERIVERRVNRERAVYSIPAATPAPTPAPTSEPAPAPTEPPQTQPPSTPAPSGDGCFLAGTAITMADGSTKPIEAIKKGDKVMSYDKKANVFKPNKVKKIFKHTSDNGYLLINGYLKVTPNHPVLSDGYWVQVGFLKVGNTLLNIKGEYEKIKTIKKFEGTNTTYNFDVIPDHNYIAGGYVVHNPTPEIIPIDEDIPKN